MKQHVPNVDLTVREVAGAWKVDLCMVWYVPGVSMMIPSREQYETEEAAIAEMKRRVMKYLEKIDPPTTPHKVNWRIVALA